METLRTRRQVIDLISDNLRKLSKEDLLAISYLCSSLSTINFEDKERDLDIARLLNFYRDPDPVPAPTGEGSVRMFNSQSFSYLQKVFVIKPNVVDFLLKEGSNKIDIFLLEREVGGRPCLDIAYKNSGDTKYYYTDEVNGGKVMNDFSTQRKQFEGNLKNILDINKNPNGHKCPTKIIVDKADLEKFNQFKTGKNNPQVHLMTGINQVRTSGDYYQRVTLVMNFASEEDGVFTPDMSYYFDTYHLCPPGSC
ncbi:hypothetical protein CEY12_16815 [Chryseobacterium sp. T16E-39]|uniref:hypothetical protein n=1 Tax=Chryseobacterium sp. T16E-39 TaxID=2015076 RepID=UPI000B5B2BE6|nr:hypothetical protein [Chryseobacterium sp. T16E-39]ASK31673.1 hypothetical protein CEY12_16815 [Chryseobacterium sp. T16E-39]